MPITNLDDALTTTAKVKTYLAITDSSEDTRLAALVLRASATISAWCDRKFAQATYTETKSGNGTHLLYVTHWPVTSPLTAVSGGLWVHSMGVFDSSSILTERASGSGHYVVHTGEDGRGLIERIAGFTGDLTGETRAKWPKGSLNIQITYQGGYSTIPYPIEHAATRLAAIYYQRAKRGMDFATSESIQAGGGSISAPEHAMPKDLIEALTPWRRSRVG